MTDLEKDLTVSNAFYANATHWYMVVIAFFTAGLLHDLASYFLNAFKNDVLHQSNEYQLGIHANVCALSIAENRNLFEKQNKVTSTIVMPTYRRVADSFNWSAFVPENVGNTYFDNILVFYIITLWEGVACWLILSSHIAIKGVLISVK